MRKLFRKKIAEGWMSVHGQAGMVGLAHVVRQSGAPPVVRMLESYAADHDFSGALKQLAKTHGLANYRCCTLLADKDYRITQTDLPEVPAGEQIAALRWQLKAAVDFPLVDAAIDCIAIPGEQQGRKQGVFAVAAARSVVASVVERFADAKIKLAAIDIPEMALRNISALFAPSRRGNALLLIGAENTQFVVTYEGDLVLSRRIDLSAPQLAAASEDRQTALLERIGLELQRTLDAFERQFSFISIAGLTIACAEDIPSLDERLKDSLYISITPLDLASVLDISAIPELRNPLWQARCLHLIGGGLRD